MKIGHACITVDENKNKIPELNYRSTTAKWLREQDDKVAEERLWDLLQHNCSAIWGCVKHLSKQPEISRMMRLGSDVCNLYTHKDHTDFWQSQEVQSYIDSALNGVAAFCSEHDIRLSFHPGQFTVLNSTTEDIRIRAAEEIEYHTRIANAMGFVDWHQQGFAINIHVGSRAGGVEGFVEGMKLLSPEAKQLLTVENDELSFSIDEVAKLKPHVAIVMDIHHEWVKSEGRRVQPDDPIVQDILESWKGVRPKIHYSLSRENIILAEGTESFSELTEAGYKKTKLRSHSDGCYSTTMNAWALSHLEWADIMVEAKDKNAASAQLIAQHTAP